MISFLSVFPPYRGGIATFSDALYRELTLQTTVNPYSFKKLYPGLLFPGTSQTLDADTPGYANQVFHPYQPLNWRKAALEIAAGHPDVLLYSYWHPFFAPGYARVIHHLKNMNPSLKVVSITHNVVPHEFFPLKQWLTRRLLDRTDLSVLLSAQTEKDFIDLDTSSNSLKLFHPIYELPEPTADRRELRNRYGFGEDDKIILFMGLVRDYKGVDLLIEAMNELHRESPDYKTMIVGEFYTDKQSLLSKISPDQKDKFTVINQFVSEQEMSDILTLADLLVLPYKDGTQSGILANAIHAGLPALISNLPGLSEHIIHRQNGLVFRTGDAQDLKQKLREYFDEGLGTHLKANLTGLKKDLSWEKFARQLLSGIESLQ